MFSMEVKGLKEALEVFDPKKVKKAARSTLRKLAAQAKTTGSSTIRQGYNIKKSDLDKNITIRASQGDLSVTITIWGKLIPAYKFGGASQIKTTKRKSGLGTTVKIRKGKDQFIRHGFIAAMPSGHTGVFIRRGSGDRRVPRLPIREIMGPSAPQLFGDQVVMDAIQNQINEQAQKIFNHEIDFFLGK